MNLQYVATADLHPWKDNPPRRAEVSTSKLRRSIERVGVLQPLTVTYVNGQMTVVDGNRRLKQAQELGIAKLPVLIYSGVNPVELAMTLNTTGQSWDAQTVGQLAAKHESALDSASPSLQGRLLPLKRLLGDDYEKFIEEYPHTAYGFAKAMLKYIGEDANDADLLRRAVWWVAKNRLVQRIRVAIQTQIPPRILRKAFETNGTFINAYAVKPGETA